VRGLSVASGRRGTLVLRVRQVVASENGAQGCNRRPIHSRDSGGQDARIKEQLDGRGSVREGGADDEGCGRERTATARITV